MTATSGPLRAPTDWTAPKMQARVVARYRRERLFRLAGLGSLCLAGLVLVSTRMWRGGRAG